MKLFEKKPIVKEDVEVSEEISKESSSLKEKDNIPFTIGLTDNGHVALRVGYEFVNTLTMNRQGTQLLINLLQTALDSLEEPANE